MSNTAENCTGTAPRPKWKLKKRTFLTLKQKVEMLELHASAKTSARKLARRFNVGKTQAADILKKRQEIMNKWYSNPNINEKRSFLHPKGIQIDNLCFEWFVNERSKGTHITGPSIQQKAKEIAASLDYHDFYASSGWLEKFRIRHNITFRGNSAEHSLPILPTVVGNNEGTLRSCLDPKERIDKLCYEWFELQTSKGHIITDSLMQKKVEEIAAILDCDDFSNIGTWIEKFCVRHNITYSSGQLFKGEIDRHSKLNEEPMVYTKIKEEIVCQSELENSEVNIKVKEEHEPSTYIEHINSYDRAIEMVKVLQDFVTTQQDEYALNLLIDLDIHFHNVVLTNDTSGQE